MTRSLTTETKRWSDVRDKNSPLSSVVDSFRLYRTDLADKTWEGYAHQLRCYAD